MEVFISPNYRANKLEKPTMDDLIDVFKDRTFNWLFKPAKKLINDKDGYFGALCLLLTYFEGIWSYITGTDSKRKSKKYFNDAFVDVFSPSNHRINLLKRVAEILYEDGRCGFFHDGFLRNRIFITDLNEIDMLITVPRKPDGNIDENGQIESVLIDPKYFMAAIERHFIDYLLSLRNPKEKIKRDNFSKIAKEKWDYEGKGTIIGLNSDGII